MHKVRAVEQVELLVTLFALLVIHQLEIWQLSLALFLHDEGNPVVDYTDKDDEESRFVESIELSYLSVKFDYLVDGTMNQAKTIFKHVHVDWASTFGWILKFEQFWVI